MSSKQIYLNENEMCCAIDALRIILHDQPKGAKCPACLSAYERLKKRVNL